MSNAVYAQPVAAKLPPDHHSDIKKNLSDKLAFLKQYFVLEGHSELYDIIRNKVFFAGGCIRDLLNNATPKDYDIYFINDEVKNAFVNYIEERDVEDFNVYNENKTYTLKIGSMTFQFITVMTGQPRDVVNRFDFFNNMNYYYPNTELVDRHPFDEFHRHWAAKRKDLTVNVNAFKPLSALVRIKKFTDRGYTISEKELAKLAVMCTQVKIETEQDLKNEISGVSSRYLSDALYHEVVKRVRSVNGSTK